MDGIRRLADRFQGLPQDRRVRGIRHIGYGLLGAALVAVRQNAAEENRAGRAVGLRLAFGHGETRNQHDVLAILEDARGRFDTAPGLQRPDHAAGEEMGHLMERRGDAAHRQAGQRLGHVMIEFVRDKVGG
jgi:hypothetical protein